MNNEPQTIDLTYYLNIVAKRFWLITAFALLGIVGAVFVNTFTRPLYTASALLMIDREDSGKIDAVKLTSWSSDEDYYRTQYNLLESRSMLAKVYNRLNLRDNPQFTYPSGIKKLKQAISVNPVTRSRLVEISASAYDPAVAADIANTLAETFVENNITNRVTMAKDVIKALESTQKSAQEQELLNSMPQVVNSDFIKNLKQQEAQTRGEYAKLSAKYTPNHPDLISLKKQLETLKVTIERETNRIVQSIKIDLSGQFSANNIRIIDKAQIPPVPSKPRKAINLAVGLMAGLFIAFIISVILEFLDQTVKSSEDVETKLNLPFLGFVPQEKIKNGALEYATMLKSGNLLLAENIRNIRTMLDFADGGNKKSAFLISSALQGEGKSNLSANLVVAMAQTGKKVLLVDGDLRRARLHKVFRLSPEKGLSNIWKEESADYATNVQETNVQGLSVVTAGIRPPNPAELLNTPKLKDFIEWAKANYDAVVIDCPAIMPVSDTLLWGKYINKAVFVIAYGKTNIKPALLCLNKLKKAGVKILGVVIGHYNLQALSYGKYGYYKHYSYYSEDKEK